MLSVASERARRNRPPGNRQVPVRTAEGHCPLCPEPCPAHPPFRARAAYLRELLLPAGPPYRTPSLTAYYLHS
ncbi:hypothetical protein EAO76_42615 [Streptomyces sp. sk2.1]|nr:hypothetical protein EAO76_42615 [Streptomyces sp. sk2.1]